jgi:hypothetical protein
MSYTVVLPNGEEVDVDAPDEKAAAQAARQYYARSSAAQPPAASAPSRRKTDRLASAAIGAADVGLAGFADEITARNEGIWKAFTAGDYSTTAAKALGYLTAPGRALFKQAGLTDLAKDYSDDPIEAARRQQLRTINRQAAEDNPLSYLAGGLAGGVATAPAYSMAGSRAVQAGMFGNGMRQAQALAPTVAKTAAQRFGAGAAAGAPQGALYGAGAGDEGNRGDSAFRNLMVGAGVGGAIGVGAPAVAKVGAPLLQAGQDGIDAAGRFANSFIPRPGTMTTNAMIGGLPRSGGGGRARPPSVPRNYDPVAEQLAKLAERENLSADQISEALRQAAADPRGRVMADILGENAVVRAGTLAELPGKTKPLAQRLMDSRTSGQLERLQADIDRQIAPSSVANAQDDIAAQFDAASEELYQPVLAQPLAPQAAAALDGIVQRLPPEIVALAERSMARTAQMRGQAAIQPGAPRYYHNLYRALGGIIRNVERNPSALEKQTFLPDDLAAMKFVKGRLMETLDQGLPGYRQAANVWRGISEAEDALEAGQRLFTGTGGQAADAAPDQIVQQLSTMSDGSRRMFEIGVRSSIRGLLQSADKDGAANIGRALQSSARRNVLRAALGERRAQALIDSIDEEIRLFRSASEMTPTRNSQSFRRTADAADMIASEMPLNPAQLANTALGYVTSPVRMGVRNRIGEALYTPADPAAPGYDPARAEELVAAIRKRALRQQAATATARTTGRAAGGAGASQNR